MTKTATLLTVILAAGILTASVRFDTAPKQKPITQVDHFDEETTIRANHYEQFKRALTDTIKALHDGQIDLASATSRIQHEAETHCDVYRTRVRVSDPGDTLEESIARNLVGHVASLEEGRPKAPERMVELQRQLKNYERPRDVD